MKGYRILFDDKGRLYARVEAKTGDCFDHLGLWRERIPDFVLREWDHIGGRSEYWDTLMEKEAPKDFVK